jgi:ABC-type transporter Mla subunit MlaD
VIDRTRMKERISPALLRLELKRALRPLMVLVIGFAVAAVAGEYILNNINGGVGGTHTIRVQIADATGVVPERAEVRFEGIEAGLVQSVDLVGGHAVLTATVAKKFGPVYKNATLTVRPNTALEDMYLDVLNRGTKNAGLATPGYVIPQSQTTSPVNAAEVLNVFEPGVRAHLYDILDQLGNGLQDRGAYLREAFIQLAPFLKIAGQVSQQLAVRADYTKELVHNTAVLTSVLSQRNVQLHDVVLAGTQTLQALSTEGGVPLQETLQDLPGVLAPIPKTTSDIDALLVKLDPAITNLYPVADRLGSALSNLRSFATAAEPALVKLRTPVQKLVPLSEHLEPFSAALASSLKKIAPQTSDVDHIVNVAAGCPSVPYAFFNWTASVTKYYDAYGAYPRGDAGIGLFSASSVTDPREANEVTCAGGTGLGAVPTTFVGEP